MRAKFSPKPKFFLAKIQIRCLIIHRIHSQTTTSVSLTPPTFPQHFNLPLQAVQTMATFAGIVEPSHSSRVEGFSKKRNKHTVQRYKASSRSPANRGRRLPTAAAAAAAAANPNPPPAAATTETQTEIKSQPLPEPSNPPQIQPNSYRCMYIESDYSATPAAQNLNLKRNTTGVKYCDHGIRVGLCTENR